MSTSRYRSDAKLGGGSQLGSADTVNKIRRFLASGTLQYTNAFLVSGFDRLDSLAGRIYGDSRYWWLLAATSNIGWGLQVPPGTVIGVVDLAEVERLIA